MLPAIAFYTNKSMSDHLILSQDIALPNGEKTVINVFKVNQDGSIRLLNTTDGTKSEQTPPR